jgi:hypothetical protein
MEQFNTHAVNSCMGSRTYTPDTPAFKTSSIITTFFDKPEFTNSRIVVSSPRASITPIFIGRTPDTPPVFIDPNDPHNPHKPNDPQDPETPAPIPVPMSAWLLLAGVGALGVIGRCKRKPAM